MSEINVSGDPSGRPADRRRVRLADRLASEMRDLVPGEWQRRAYGATAASRVRIEDDPLVADAIAQAWDLARSRPGPDLVWSRTGPGGAVVVAHGPGWSLVARAGGPILLLAQGSEQVARLDGDPDWAGELVVLVEELLAASRGDPPFEESRLPPPPTMPWHHTDRDGYRPGTD
jgi:hypothetical protein